MCLCFCSCVGFRASELKGAKCHQGYLLPIVHEFVHVKLVELVLVRCNNIIVSTLARGLSPKILLRLKSGLFLFIGSNIILLCSSLLESVNVGEDKSESPAEWRSRLKPVANK